MFFISCTMDMSVLGVIQHLGAHLYSANGWNRKCVTPVQVSSLSIRSFGGEFKDPNWNQLYVYCMQ